MQSAAQVLCLSGNGLFHMIDKKRTDARILAQALQYRLHLVIVLAELIRPESGSSPAISLWA